MDSQVKYLADYKPTPYLINQVELTFHLQPENTVVKARSKVHRNKHSKESSSSIELVGEDQKLLQIMIDDRPLNECDYEISSTGLKIDNCPDDFILEIHTEINPKGNTKLEGLYMSGGYYCTQNEAEGFRRITYFYDRPDVMATYTTKIIADQKEFPVLLSNGNLIEKGRLDNEEHFAVWHDPFPKPCYLFALVAGDLGLIEDKFTTKSGREVDLRIYCDHGDELKCAFAMDVLKKSMKWDEEKYGLEYDLDIFMIVVISSFNAGAMENKGLNIFNSVAVLADKDIATDQNFTYVERVIAHEYFHNWTGDRITCRDWFQLTLKEGLTVFRDHQFSADMNVKELRRIEDVIDLKTTQFPEDMGPTSHPIQPKSYLEVNNFYTRTVYEKGAEVIRMMETLVGWESFRKGMDRYFELYDGMAVTTENFVHAIESASLFDFTQFRRWYHQNGTPTIDVNYSYNEEKQQFTLTVKQSCKPKVCEVDMQPFHFPLRVGLIAGNGEEVELFSESGRKEGNDLILEVKNEVDTFVFDRVSAEPIPSVNRFFSAPVNVNMPFDHHDYLHLMRYDSDAYNRFEASQEIGLQLMQQQVVRLQNGESLEIDAQYLATFGDILRDKKIDVALKAKFLSLPSETLMMQRQEVYTFEANFEVREFFAFEIARHFEDDLIEIVNKMSESEFSLSSESKGKRSLKGLANYYLCMLGKSETVARLFTQFNESNNMTDRYSALKLLCDIHCSQRDEALAQFYEQYKDDDLVMMKWFAVQGGSKLDSTFERVKELIKDDVFDYKVPNLVRSLFVSFMNNHNRFHSTEDSVYQFFADEVIKVDKVNPYTAARLAGAFKKVGKLEHSQKQQMHKQMRRILEVEGLSVNTYEIIDKSLD
ncbi:MAG: aminopeptidase N [Rhabdochlamydiaceae bacterium]|nr:aminopeptidase N [Candidatus Amphrikana amoebophyrae]